MSDPSGFANPDATAPGPRRQGVVPDPELESLLAAYTQHRDATPTPGEPGILPVDDTFQAPPMSAFNAAHLGDTPSGFVLPDTANSIPGPAPIPFDELLLGGGSGFDTPAPAAVEMNIPDPAAFFTQALAQEPEPAWAPQPAEDAWPEALTFETPAPQTFAEPVAAAQRSQTDSVFDAEQAPHSGAGTPVFDELLFESPAVADSDTFALPPIQTPTQPQEMAEAVEVPSWDGATEVVNVGSSVFDMPGGVAPWKQYEDVEQHEPLPLPAPETPVVPALPTIAEYAPFEVAPSPEIPDFIQQPAAAVPPRLFEVPAQPEYAPTPTPDMFTPATVTSTQERPQPEWKPAPQQSLHSPAPFEWNPHQQVPAAAAAPFEWNQEAQIPHPPLAQPAALVSAFTPVEQAPQNVPPGGVEQPAGAQPQVSVQPALPLAPQFSQETQQESFADARPQPVWQPQPEQSLPSGFFDDDFAGMEYTPVELPPEDVVRTQPALPAPGHEVALPALVVAPMPVAPAVPTAAVEATPAQVAEPEVEPQPTAVRAPLTVAATPARSAPAASPDSGNRLVAEVAPVADRLPLNVVAANLPVNEQWLDEALRQLVVLGVSDVHIVKSGARDEMTIQGRRDGVLEPVRVLRNREANMVLNLVKSGSRISTGSNRVPADGRYTLEIDNYPYSLRAVATPLFDGGEKVVLRLPQTGALKELPELGFTEKNLSAVYELLSSPGGMTIIAGPMGEGKTTTAHAALSRIGGAGSALMSVEDPVERVLPQVAQIEVNEDIGAGFGDIMRYLVRADFDTLFLGEIRDEATAAAAVRMAQAGRRVISTIHATDNVTALRRLIEMSADTPLSVLDAVRGIISQRLVRRTGNGPDGYLGRHPIHEVLTMNDTLIEALVRNQSIADIRTAAETTSTTFAENARFLIETDVTDVREIRRVLGPDAV